MKARSGRLLRAFIFYSCICPFINILLYGRQFRWYVGICIVQIDLASHLDAP